MKFSDFIVDLASVLNASGGVASHHIALRAQQLERRRRVAQVYQRQRGGSAAQANGDGPDESRSANKTTQKASDTDNVFLDSMVAHATSDSESHVQQSDQEKKIDLEDVPADVSLNVFRTKRVAKMLGAEMTTNSHRTHFIRSPFILSHTSLHDHAQKPLAEGKYLLESGHQLLCDALHLVDIYKANQLVSKLQKQKHIYHPTHERFALAQEASKIGNEYLNRGDSLLSEGIKVINEWHSQERIGYIFHLGREALRNGSVLTTQTNEAIIRSKFIQNNAEHTLNEAVMDSTAQALDQPDISTAFSMQPNPYKNHSHSHTLRESRVPSTRLGRLWNYGGLAAGMLGGAVTESVSRMFGGRSDGSSVMLSSSNMERLVAKLSRMRGAALKLGQMMSFQDSKMLPPSIQEVLQRVQDRADYMPSWQRDKVLASNLGKNWRNLFEKFDEKPIAAASIGQVHRAQLKNGKAVAVKIQFPGVADSINSDLDNLAVLLAATKLLPKGLYLDKTINNARTELAWECDYEREAACAERYKMLMADELDTFLVPEIYHEACGKQVITMEFMEGVGVTRIKEFNQDQKDWIGTQLLRLCLREIAEFRFMQTDPNWTNFLFNAATQKLELLDFGASREFPEKFTDLYVRLLVCASKLDRAGVKQLSEELGYLTGMESKTMVDAHIASVLTLAEPFLDSAPEVYDFKDQTITERVKSYIPIMVKERLSPPPEETYSLHRKLSGAFLLCARLGSKVPCRQLFLESMRSNGFA